MAIIRALSQSCKLHIFSLFHFFQFIIYIYILFFFKFNTSYLAKGENAKADLDFAHVYKILPQGGAKLALRANARTN